MSSLNEKTIGERMSYSEEKQQLEKQLAEVPRWKERLEEVCQLLGGNEDHLNMTIDTDDSE